MLRVFDTNESDVFAILRRRTIHRDQQTEEIVRSIIEDVKARGDLALLESARRFDAPGLESIEVDVEAEVAVPQLVAASIERALLQVQAFHTRQMLALTKGWEAIELQTAEARRGDGQKHHVSRNFEYRWRKNPHERQGWADDPESLKQSDGYLGQRLLPLRSAGVYVPGGNANYPSSVVMNVIPAQCAGVNAVFVTTPARRDGSLHPAVLAALGYCGVAKAFKIGGAAAIAALALGTESVPRVEKIVGPGNRFVNEAKRQLWGMVGLDGYAGPSEVCVLADATTKAKYAAADFLTQIEHAPDNAGFLVCTDRAKLDEIIAEIIAMASVAERKETLFKAIENESMAVLVRDRSEACAVANAIAPEHLSVVMEDPEAILEEIRNAGCVLLGEWSPESAGDFAAGPSHTLPTSGAARFGSPVNVLDFLKVQSLIHLSKPDLAALRGTIETFGSMEGFPIHALGSSVRFDEDQID